MTGSPASGTASSVGIVGLPLTLLLAEDRIRVTGFDTDPAKVAALDAILICVPTPLHPDHTSDMRAVTATIDALAPHFHPGQLVVLESTTYPGTTEEIIVATLERAGKKVLRSTTENPRLDCIPVDPLYLTWKAASSASNPLHRARRSHERIHARLRRPNYKTSPRTSRIYPRRRQGVSPRCSLKKMSTTYANPPP